ncbi:hypothetical protein KUTeg_014244 [Tegillarca granosa]|uniref:Uncharacterized protein n=1 Tax=Tegillarca granosa TaxID=220873 RepID=A0ABQ9EZT0_TEGGR|nr:hypothetical protein KUTeg_014244 [Tegillarca granosa]
MAEKPKDVPKDPKMKENDDDKMESEENNVNDDTVKKLLFMEKVKRKPGVLNPIDYIPPPKDPRYDDMEIDLSDVIAEERKKEAENKK